MANSESESDSFLSADEFESDNEDNISIKNNSNVENNNVDIKKIDTLLSVSSETKNIKHAGNILDNDLRSKDDISTSDRHEETPTSEDECEVRSYRKRPERLKNTIDKNSKIKTSDFIPNIDIAKVARSEVLTDFTHQFTAKISKGLATFQEKSSSLKGFVKETLVTDMNKFEGSKFVYDDDRTRGIKDEEDTSLLEETPKSNINDEILKLSNAFAKLNEKREGSTEHAQQPDLCYKINLCTQTGDLVKEEIAVSSNPHVKITDEPCVSTATNEVAPEHEEASSGWDECNDDLLPEAASDIKSNTTEKGVNFTELSSDFQNDKVTSADFNNDEWGDVIEFDYKQTEGNLKSKEQPTQVVPDTNKKEVDIEPAIEKTVVNQQVIQETPDQNKSLDGWGDWEIGSEDEEVHNGDKMKTENIQLRATIQDAPYAKDDTLSEEQDGWDNWGDDDIEDETHSRQIKDTSADVLHPKKDAPDEQDGWDDWGDDEFPEVTKEEKYNDRKKEAPRTLGSQAMKSSNASKTQEWSGWDSFGQKKENDWNLGGWGINTLLSTATAVTSNISSAIESGLGVPDPETMARMAVEEEKKSKNKKGVAQEDSVSDVASVQFPFKQLVAGVGKIVEVAKVQEIGSRVLSGGLDTLETIGKKTMEVLQEGDPGLKKKRALIAEQGQMLSKVLKDARDRAMEEDRYSKEMRIDRRCHFETLFDDFQGLVHLEALEMLSRQCELRLEQIQQSLPPDRQKELQETLEEVKELCEVDEEFDDVEVHNFEEAISEVVAPLKNELSVYKIIEVHKRLSEWLKSENIVETGANQLYDEAISTMAELTAAITMQFHKSGELLILKERRKTVEEADCLMQLSSHLCYGMKTITNGLEDQLRKKTDGDISNLISNLQSECENAVGYIKQAFKLLVPVIQLGTA